MTDPDVLDRAAAILRKRDLKHTFAIRVICRVLERTADQMRREAADELSNLGQEIGM